uniref:Uncharacterized protein n=1 Tax=Alternaria sp. FA0703 TaxID=588201 RepID=B8YQB6_9PLEO|nr:hypothetical protein [Alternaria sp. FA0703]
MFNTTRKPILPCSGPVPSDDARIVDRLDRDTDPFGVSRTQFPALHLLRVGHPGLREVRISKVGANHPVDQAVPIDEDVRVLVAPGAYEDLQLPGNPSKLCYFFVAGRYPPFPLYVGILRLSSDNRSDGTTYAIAATASTGDRPGALAHWAFQLKRTIVVPSSVSVEGGEGDEHIKI